MLDAERERERMSERVRPTYALWAWNTTIAYNTYLLERERERESE